MRNFLIVIFSFFSITNFAFNQPTLAELEERSPEQKRDLSIPGSRIIINPFSFFVDKGMTQSEYSNHPSYPLNLGYLSNDRTGGRWINDLFEIFQLDSECHYKISKKENINWVWGENFANQALWKSQSDSFFQINKNRIHFGVNANAKDYWQSLKMKDPIEIDFDKNPSLAISIIESAGKWSLKISDTEGTEFVLRSDAYGLASKSFDLKRITNWNGKKKIYIELFSIELNAYFICDQLSIYEQSDILNDKKTAKTIHTTWRPDRLSFILGYGNNEIISGYDYFADKNTIIREIDFSKSEDKTKYVLSGFFMGNSVSFKDNILLVETQTYRINLTSSIFKNNSVRFFKSGFDFENNLNPSESPSDYGYWKVEFESNSLEDKIIRNAISISYNNDTIPIEKIQQLSNLISASKTEIIKSDNEEYWDYFLSKIPHPSDFEIRDVDAKGVSTEINKLNYYKAWIFIASNLLDPDPKYFPFYQIVTGKGSMWDEGHHNAPYSATWESFFGIQFYAFIDPEIAWNAFEGLMSLTDEEGVIGGESLPSRKAQTAWILYQQTLDKNKLENVYDELERYLDWRIKYPHWVYKCEPDTAKKDAEFVFSALVDLEYMKKICSVLGKLSEMESWEIKKEKLYRKSLLWFWDSPEKHPVQLFNTQSNDKSIGMRYWVTTGLNVDLLEKEHLKSMLALFDSYFDPNQNFGGVDMGWPKYPDLSYTVYGLYNHGYAEKARQVIDVCVRDVARSGNWFAEQYEGADQLVPGGVRPSLFGACIMIDFIMMKNGFRYDKGDFSVIRLSENSSELKNIFFRNKKYHILNKGKGKIEIKGQKSKELRFIKKSQTVRIDL